MDRDVSHRHLSDGAASSAVVGVAVDDQIRAMHPDRCREPPRSEKRPDRLGLADERVRDRRVVHEDDANVAPGDGLQPLFERLHLERGLLVDAAEERLAEIRQLGTRKPADEPFHPHDSDLSLTDFEDEVLAIENVHSRGLEHVDDLDATIGMLVVVAEDGEDASRESTAGFCEHRGLLRQPVRREVAGEQHEVGVLRHCRERPPDVIAEGLGCVDVAGRCNPDRSGHEDPLTRGRDCENARTQGRSGFAAR